MGGFLFSFFVNSLSSHSWWEGALGFFPGFTGILALGPTEYIKLLPKTLEEGFERSLVQSLPPVYSASSVK